MTTAMKSIKGLSIKSAHAAIAISAVRRATRSHRVAPRSGPCFIGPPYEAVSRLVAEIA
jgi:hypothetical protein